MTQRKRYSVVRDPVHGDVYLTHEELRLLDTPEMQRLRGVKQLGSAYLVYPGAVHTRFEHSIGSLHVAQKMIEAIGRNASLEPAACVAVREEEARVVRAAALVHDVTHIPFGHNFEDQDGIFWRHDSAYRFERMFSKETGIGRALAELGLQADVLRILTKEPDPERPAIPPFWREIVSGTVCSDILDYLARDAYFTGLKLEIDPRVVSYFKVDRTTSRLYIDLAKHDLLREDILSEIVRMLEARYYFSERVYYHHAKVVAGAMVARAVELGLALGLVAEEDFHAQTDASLLDLLDRSAAGSRETDAERVRTLVTRFRERRLYKRACVFPLAENEAVQEEIVQRFFGPGGVARKRDVEERIVDLVRFATGRRVDVILYCPAKRMQLKEARTYVRWPGEKGVAPLAAHERDVPRLGDLRENYRKLWKFYVLADTADTDVLRKVQEVAQAEFAGAKNLYRLEA